MPDQKLPARKKMLAYTLRKLARKQRHSSFLRIKEFSHMVGKEWLQLKQKGEESFMSEMNEEQLARQHRSQRLRKVLNVLTLSYGEQSRQNAFTIWKENTVLKGYVQKQRDLVARYKEEAETEKRIAE